MLCGYEQNGLESAFNAYRSGDDFAMAESVKRILTQGAPIHPYDAAVVFDHWVDHADINGKNRFFAECIAAKSWSAAAALQCCNLLSGHVGSRDEALEMLEKANKHFLAALAMAAAFPEYSDMRDKLAKEAADIDKVIVAVKKTPDVPPI